jgi:hypothetical protein
MRTADATRMLQAQLPGLHGGGRESHRRSLSRGKAMALAHDMGMTYSEIAEVLGLTSAATVREQARDGRVRPLVVNVRFERRRQPLWEASESG